MSFTSASRWSDVFIAAAAQLASAAGAFLVMTTLLLRLEDDGASGLQVAALVVVEALPMVLLAKLTGRAADRFDSRILLVVAGLAQMAACFVLAQAASYAAIVLGALALSTATAAAQPVRQALLPSMVTRDDLPKASALGQTAGSIGMLIGPATAGLLVGAVGDQETVRVAGTAFLGTVLAGLLIRTRRGRSVTAIAGDRPGVPAVPWRLGDDRLLTTLIWSMALVVGLVSAVNVVGVFFIRGTLNSSATLYGIIGSSWTLGMLLGAWIFARMIKSATDDGRVAMLLFWTLAQTCVIVAASAAITDARWIVPIYLVGGMGNGGTNVIIGTLVGRRIPAEVRGTGIAALQARVQAAALLGFMAGGALLGLLTPRWIILGAGMLGTLGVLAVLPGVLRVTAPRTAVRASVPPIGPLGGTYSPADAQVVGSTE